ncbi:hypothetical protein ACHAWF_004825 [Thalassiosira exigua]
MQDRFNKMEHRNWEQGFEAYDQGFGTLTQQTIKYLLSNAGFPPDSDECSLLDVATGPGFVISSAIETASTKTTQKSFHFTGLDITQNFLNLAERRTKAQMQQHQIDPKRIKVDFVEGSAEAMPFPENTFDSVVCNFGILHFFKPDTFLRESYRVLHPGGKVSFTAWAPPSRTEGFNIAFESIAQAGNPNVEGLPEGPNFFDFGDEDHAMEMLGEAGFENVKSKELSRMEWSCIENGSDLYDVLLHGTSRTREILLGQTPEEATAIQSLMVEKYNIVTNGGKRRLSMPAVVTSGQKPAP